MATSNSQTSGFQRVGVSNKVGVKTSNSFCGTPDYLAPEIISGKGHNKMVDYWTFGCLIYEMLMGFPPFQTSGKSQKQLFDTIVKGSFKLPTRMDEDVKDLIKRLLVTDVTSQ